MEFIKANFQMAASLQKLILQILYETKSNFTLCYTVR